MASRLIHISLKTLLKLVLFFMLFMFYSVLIMNTSTCHAITFSLFLIMIYLLNYVIKMCQTLPIFLSPWYLFPHHKLPFIATKYLWKEQMEKQ
jgi:hypothetical protein